MKVDNFTNVPLCASNLDRYYARLSILRSLKKALPELQGVLLDLGCGEMPYKSFIEANRQISKYIGMDLAGYQDRVKPDLVWDGREIPLDDASIDSIMATEVFEHLPDLEGVLREARRVLKPGGVLFFTVPFLWPIHDPPNDEYRYTPFSLRRHFKNAGFSEVTIKALGGWDASLAQMIGLWVRRRPMSAEQREKLTSELWGFYLQLLGTDEITDELGESVMVTGFWGIAR